MGKLYLKADLVGEVISEEKRDSIMNLIKVMYRLDIIDVEQAMKIAMQYQILLYN